MIIKNPTVNELLWNLPNLQEGVGILIRGLQDKTDPDYVLFLWSKFLKEDRGSEGGLK